jgi:hypothetical protein
VLPSGTRARPTDLSEPGSAARRHPLTSNPAPAIGSALDPEGLAEVRRIGSADLMVGIPSFGNAETIGYVVRAATAGMVQYFPELKPVLVNSDGGSPDDTPRVAVSTESPDYL